MDFEIPNLKAGGELNQKKNGFWTPLNLKAGVNLNQKHIEFGAQTSRLKNS